MPRIKELRQARGMSQEALAYASGLSLRTVARAEAGTHRPHTATLIKIAAALRVPIGDLFSEAA